MILNLVRRGPWPGCRDPPGELYDVPARVKLDLCGHRLCST